MDILKYISFSLLENIGQKSRSDYRGETQKFTHINVEITKSYKSSQDREWQSIKDHFEETIKNHSNKNCFLIFVSPETYYRTINSIKDWNFAHIKDKDKKIMPVCFSTFELLIN